MVVVVVAYADDITLLAPTPSAIRYMLQICEEYGCEFCFTAAKSASMYCGKKLASCPGGLTFYTDGNEIAVVKKYLHLGHIISVQLDDEDDILANRNSLCGKINNVLCYFRSRDALVKVKLLRHYCCNFYGSVIWNKCKKLNSLKHLVRTTVAGSHN